MVVGNDGNSGYGTRENVWDSDRSYALFYKLGKLNRGIELDARSVIS